MSFDFLAWWESFSQAPFVLLIILLFIIHFFYLRYFRYIRITVASPSIIMALGGFALVCMPEIHVPISLMLIVTESLLLVWAYLTVALLYSYSHDKITFVHPLQKLEVGTWVVSSALMTLIIDQIEPTLYGFILWLGFASVFLYIVYVCLIVRWLREKHLKIDGRIMLCSIATLSLALLAMEVFGNAVPINLYQGIILLGLVLSVLGLLAICKTFIRQWHKHFLVTWSVTNCLIYAAFAMIGFAALETHAFSHTLIFIDWYVTMVCFIIIESLEIVRLLMKLCTQRFLKVLGTYHVLQWLRIFSLTMLQGFALSYYNHHYVSSDLLAFIANYGSYVVAFVMFFELSLITLHITKHGEHK